MSDNLQRGKTQAVGLRLPVDLVEAADSLIVPLSRAALDRVTRSTVLRVAIRRVLEEIQRMIAVGESASVPEKANDSA
jgi:hypothetical protein